jgi:hypothetical protein
MDAIIGAIMTGVSKAGTLCYASHPLLEKCSRKMFLEGIGAKGQAFTVGPRVRRNGVSRQRPRHPEKCD